MRTRIKVRNYRCFGDEPAYFIIEPGLTSIVGVNNSGKTALIKTFYELRNLWDHLALSQFHSLFPGGPSFSISLLGVEDSSEIYNHHTDRKKPVFEFEFSSKEQVLCFSIELTPDEGNSSVQVRTVEIKIDNVNVQLYSSNISASTFTVVRQNDPTQIIYSYAEVNSFFSSLRKSIYIPAFRNMINVGARSNYYDISTGTDFISTWNIWKNGAEKIKRDKIIEITDDIRALFEYKSLEINSSSKGEVMNLVIDGKSSSILDVGSGIAQFILTFANAAIKQPDYIFIDEPELNLHPALQLKFITSLNKYARKGIIFTTHSIGLSRHAETQYSVRNNGTSSRVFEINLTPDYTQMLGELSFNSFKEIGADSILFTEGITDVLVMREFLRKYRKDNKVLIMSLGGADMINPKRRIELQEITRRLPAKVFAWIDSEKTGKEFPIDETRVKFKTMCGDIGVDCMISEKRQTENYFTQNAIDATLGLGVKGALGDFDKFDQDAHWSKREHNVKIAKNMTLSELMETDLGKFLEKI